MSDIDLQRLYERIKSIADQLVARDDHFTRADLAYELRGDGISGDSSEVSRLVWEAYRSMGEDPHIREAFLDNSSSKSLVDEYRIIDLIESSESAKAVSVVTKLLEEGKRAMDRVLLQVDEASRDYRPDVKPQLSQQAVDTIIGTAGIKAIQAESEDLLRRYAGLVEAYKEAKGDIKGAITAYGELREQVLYSYREWVALLKDLFGDRIHSVAPELFDFDKLRWIDVDEMYSRAKLSFDSLSGRASELLSSISEDFRTSLSDSVRDYSYSSGRRLALVMAAVNLVTHYSKTVGDTARLKGQLLDLRSDVVRDASSIQADMARLVEVYRTINDLYLSRADLFYQYGERVFSSEWRALRETLYSDPEVKQIVREREEIYKHMRELEEKMLDARLNITYYRGQVETTKVLLDSLEGRYREALEAKPKEPSWLRRTVTLGKARESYGRDLTEWDKYDGEIVRKYEELRVDLRVFGEEIDSLQRTYDTSLKEYHQSRMDAGDLTEHIHELQTLSPTMLSDATAHLAPVLKLLSVARDIIESPLEDRLVAPQSLRELEQSPLSSEMTERIDRLRQRLQGVEQQAAPVIAERVSRSVAPSRPAAPQDEQRARQLAQVAAARSRVAAQDEQRARQLAQVAAARSRVAAQDEQRARQLAQVAAARSRVAAQRSAAAVDELLLLRQKEVASKVTEEHYRRELERIRETFQYNMRQIDDKSAFVAEVRRRVHTDLTDERVREDLLLLAGEGSQDLGPDDLRKLLSGEMTLDV